MKNALIACLVLLSSCIPALCQQDWVPATKEDVRQLMELTGARGRVQQMWAVMAQQAATMAAGAYHRKHPGATPAQLRKVAEATAQYMQESYKAFSIDELMAAIVPIYQRHLTHADVRGIIDFFSSPVGQKYLKQMPAMTAESMDAIQPIIQKHLPEMEAAAEKMSEKVAKPASTGTGSHSQ